MSSPAKQKTHPVTPPTKEEAKRDKGTLREKGSFLQESFRSFKEDLKDKERKVKKFVTKKRTLTGRTSGNMMDYSAKSPAKQKDKHAEAKAGATLMAASKLPQKVLKKTPKELGKYAYTKYLKKAAKASKDPYFKDVLGKKGFEAAQKIAKTSSEWKGLKKAPQATFKPITKPPTAIAQKLSTPASRALKAFKTTPKQLAKGVTVKGAGKVASRAIPVIGEALMTYDVLKTGVKRIAKGIKTGVPQTKLKGKNIKDTFKRVEKKKYI